MKFIKYLLNYHKNIDELQAYERALSEANRRLECAKVLIGQKEDEVEEIYNANDGLHKEISGLKEQIKVLEKQVEDKKELEEKLKKKEEIDKAFNAMMGYNYKTALKNKRK